MRLTAVRAEEATQKVSIGLRDDPIQPLIIRANEGECLTINYTNNADGGDFGVHVDGLAFDVASSGDAIGNNAASGVSKGLSRTYTYYVPNDKTLEGAHYLHPGPGFPGPGQPRPVRRGGGGASGFDLPGPELRG